MERDKWRKLRLSTCTILCLCRTISFCFWNLLETSKYIYLRECATEFHKDVRHEMERDKWRKLRLSTCTILCLCRTISFLVVNIPLSKFAKVSDFKAHFPLVLIIFRLLVYFKTWQNRVKVDDRVFMNSDTIFVSLKGYETTKRLMAIFCLAKMKEKIYMFNKQKMP